MKTNEQIMKDYKSDMETLKASLRAKEKESEAVFNRVLDEKVQKSKEVEAMKKENSKVQEQLQSKARECDTLTNKVNETTRILDFVKEKLGKTEKELETTRLSLKEVQIDSIIITKTDLHINLTDS